MDKLPIRVNKYPFFTNYEEPWRNCYLCAQFSAEQPTDGEDITILGGRKYPLHDMVEFEGHWYCTKHFEFRFNKYLREQSPIDVGDDFVE